MSKILVGYSDQRLRFILESGLEIAIQELGRNLRTFDNTLEVVRTECVVQKFSSIFFNFRLSCICKSGDYLKHIQHIRPFHFDEMRKIRLDFLTSFPALLSLLNWLFYTTYSHAGVVDRISDLAYVTI